MTLIIATTVTVIASITIYHCNKTSKKLAKQRKMLKNIESLIKEILKLYYFYKDFGDMDSFMAYLQNASKRLRLAQMSEKEFINYKSEFKNKMITDYKNLLYEIAFVNPNIKKILNQEYFGKIS